MPSITSTTLNQPGTQLQNSIPISSGVPLQGSMTINGNIMTASSSTITIDPNAWAAANGWGNGYWGINSAGSSSVVYNSPIIYPTQSIIFKIGEGFEKDEDIFIGRFKDIIEDEIHFSPLIDGKKIQPLETIMKYIKLQKKMDIKLTRVGYDIKIKGVTFKAIRNLLSKDSDTTLKVAFEYDELIYDNTLLTLEEKRSIKVRELAKKINKDDI